MKLTVLGSGITITPEGTDFRYSSCHLIEEGDTKILFDAGIGVLPQLAKLNIKVTDIDVICISHFHADHFVLEPILQAFYLHGYIDGQKPKLKIIGPEGIKQKTRQGYTAKGWNFDDDLMKMADLNFVEYKDGTDVNLVDDLRLTAYKTKHYDQDAYTLKLRNSNSSIGYSGDSSISPALSLAAKESDIFLCEAGIRVDANHDDGHVSAKEAALIAMESEAKQLVLTHYSGADSEEAIADYAKSSGYTGPIVVANDLSSFSF